MCVSDNVDPYGIYAHSCIVGSGSDFTTYTQLINANGYGHYMTVESAYRELVYKELPVIMNPLIRKFRL